jgi:UDP-N-acetylmuramoylalanine--D-glutamate ligase
METTKQEPEPQSQPLSQLARDTFAEKKITLMGLGLLGRGLGDAKFLAAAGADLIITDLKTETELASSVAALADVHGPNGAPAKITFHLGGHLLEDFENRDLVIKAPNTPLDSPFIAHARERGIPIEMDASLFVKLSLKLSAPPITVGITGTRGKSTTTQLIFEMAKAAGKNPQLGGNVRDTATLPFIERVSGTVSTRTLSGTPIILELDSWQLQGFAEDKLSPHVAVWTNFMPDHMNYYHGDVERYFEDKAAIARFQKAGDFFIAPRDIKERIETHFGPLAGAWIDPTAPENIIPADWAIALPGEHNRANAASARATARCLGISDDVVKNVLMNFSSLPNRLELLGEKNDIAFYNDSNATTPEATLVALRTLAGDPRTKDRPIILIAGGNDKELSFETLADEIAASIAPTIKKLILFPGKATDKLTALLPKDFPIAPVKNMDEAFAAAFAATAPGDIVLLSPAATSFGTFKNEYDRGDQFRAKFAE